MLPTQAWKLSERQTTLGAVVFFDNDLLAQLRLLVGASGRCSMMAVVLSAKANRLPCACSAGSPAQLGPGITSETPKEEVEAAMSESARKEEKKRKKKEGLQDPDTKAVFNVDRRRVIVVRI